MDFNDLEYDFPLRKSKKANRWNKKITRTMMAEQWTDFYDDNEFEYYMFIQEDNQFFDSEPVRPHTLGLRDTQISFIYQQR